MSTKSMNAARMHATAPVSHQLAAPPPRTTIDGDASCADDYVGFFQGAVDVIVQACDDFPR